MTRPEGSRPPVSKTQLSRLATFAKEPRSPADHLVLQARSVCPPPVESSCAGGPSNVGTKDKQTTCTMRGSVAEMTLQVAPILRDWGRVAFLRHVVFVTVLYAALIEPLERAESAPTQDAWGRTGLWTKAVISPTGHPSRRWQT